MELSSQETSGSGQPGVTKGAQLSLIQDKGVPMVYSVIGA